MAMVGALRTGGGRQGDMEQREHEESPGHESSEAHR